MNSNANTLTRRLLRAAECGASIDAEDLQTLKQAALDDAEAQRLLGFLYEHGCGVEKDVQSAFNLYRKAARSGDSKAAYNVGVMCLDRENYPSLCILTENERISLGESSLWDGIKNGNSDAMAFLGEAKVRGIILPLDLANGLELLRMSHREGNSEGTFRLAKCCECGIGCEVDVERAVELLERAVAGGHGQAAYELGYRYFEGIGVETDVQKALSLFKASADAGWHEGLAYEGEILAMGLHGVNRNVEAGAQYLQKAASQGNARAFFVLGVIAATGIKGEVDRETARDFFRRAAAAGEPNAVNALEKLL